MPKINYISIAKKVANHQISELKKIKKVFNKSFAKSVDLISSCKGKVITAGIGKKGLIARKFLQLYLLLVFHLLLILVKLTMVILVKLIKETYC